MVDAEWKQISEKLSLLITGAGAAFACQKLYRSIVGVPPCKPDETSKAILLGIETVKDRIAKVDDRLDSIEKIARPSPDK